MMTFEKDPTAVLDYEIDWSQWLATGETITASTWEMPAGISETSSSHTDTAATVWLSASPVGTYLVANTITTTMGRTDSRTLHILCVQR